MCTCMDFYKFDCGQVIEMSGSERMLILLKRIKDFG